MEGCVAVVCDVGDLQRAGVVLDDSFDEEDVVEVKGAAEADGGVNHHSVPQSLSMNLI